MFFKRVLFVALLLVLGIAAISYAQDDEEETVLFIGTTADNPDEFVGLAIQGENVTLYICDGQPDKGTISIAQWFVGTLEEDAIDITAANGNRVEVSIDDDVATGIFTFTDGSTREFVLEISEEAALFRSEFAFGEDEFVAGWLILEDGSVRGGAFKKRTEELVPASFTGSLSLVGL